MTIRSISQSLINSWEACPEAFRRERIENEYVPYGLLPKIGTGVHRGAETNHYAKLSTRRDEPLDVVTDAARDGYIESLDDGVYFPADELPSAKKQIAEGVDTTISLATIYYQSLAPQIQPLLVEHRVEMQSDLTLFGERKNVVAIIDCHTEDNWTMDFKTVQRIWSQHRVDTSPQATIYNEAIKAWTGDYPRKLTFEFLVRKKIPIHFSAETTRMPTQDYQALLDRVRVIFSMIEAGFFPPAPADHWKCGYKYCPFFWTCKYIPKHRKLLPKRSN